MHVTLCVSGKYTGEDFTNLLRERIPHDSFYTATYTGSDYDADFYMDEPELIYHPILDTEPYPDKESVDRRKAFTYNNDSGNVLADYFSTASKHWYKQILIHNHMMKNIPECDIVIRSRFDCIPSKEIDWEDFVKKSYEKDIPIGFNTLNLAYNYWFNRLKPMHDGAKFYINDALIIHPYDIWDTELVDTLYKDKKLKGAEEGWYQILSEPQSMYHESYHGGAYLSKYWDKIDDVDESLHN